MAQGEYRGDKISKRSLKLLAKIFNSIDFIKAIVCA